MCTFLCMCIYTCVYTYTHILERCAQTPPQWIPSLAASIDASCRKFRLCLVNSAIFFVACHC